MKNRYRNALFPFLFAVAILTAACRPEVELPVTDNAGLSYYVNTKTYREIAFKFWQGVNLNYVFWDIEPVRFWDNVLDEYLPKISTLGTWDPDNTQKNSQFAEYLAGMVANLHDGHFGVQFDNHYISPQETRVNARFDKEYDDTNPARTFWLNDWSEDSYPDFPNSKKWNFAKDLIIPKYLTDGTWAVSGNLLIAQGKIDMAEGHIDYLYFNEFSLAQTMANDTAVKTLLDNFWVDLHSQQCVGVIFDLRGNTGGRNSDIEYLIRPLLAEKLCFANLRTKKNESRLSYTPWIPYTLSPNNPIPNAGKIPVVALINDYSISCGELLPLAVKSMPHGYLIGTRTYGATGPRYGNDFPNALNDGSFTVRWTSGSLNVIQAGYQTRGKNLENYEGIGIEPDIHVPFSWSKFTNNGKYDSGCVDAQLKTAIDYIVQQG
jgi:hypothetical protein